MNISWWWHFKKSYRFKRKRAYFTHPYRATQFAGYVESLGKHYVEVRTVYPSAYGRAIGFVVLWSPLSHTIKGSVTYLPWYWKVLNFVVAPGLLLFILYVLLWQICGAV